MRSVPFTRIGLLLIVGALFASVINFYAGVGRQLADFNAEDLDTDPRGLFDHFTQNFLFAGEIPGMIFWIGIAVCIIGIVRNICCSKKPIHN